MHFALLAGRDRPGKSVVTTVPTGTVGFQRTGEPRQQLNCRGSFFYMYLHFGSIIVIYPPVRNSTNTRRKEVAKLTIEIEAEAERTALTELQNLISGAIDESTVTVNYRSVIDNHAGPVTTAPPVAVRLSDLVDESASPNARRAITVLGQNAGVIWLTQLMEMTEEDALSVHYLGETLLPDLKELLKQHGHTWPTK